MQGSELDTKGNPILESLFRMEAFSNGYADDLRITRSAYNQIVIFTEGKGIIDIDGTPVLANMNNILIFSKGQTYRFEENDLSGYKILFSDSFWKHTPISANNCKAVLFDVGLVKHRIVVSAAELNKLKVILAATLLEYVCSDYSNKPDVLAAYLKIIVIKIANLHALLKEDIGDDHNKLYQDFIAMVNNDVINIHDVASYAARLGVSARRLSVTCNLFGKGTKAIINDRLMSEAKRSLQYTTKPIKEISSDLSFSTPYQFSNFFKKHTALSPESYRKAFVKIGI